MSGNLVFSGITSQHPGYTAWLVLNCETHVQLLSGMKSDHMIDFTPGQSESMSGFFIAIVERACIWRRAKSVRAQVHFQTIVIKKQDGS